MTLVQGNHDILHEDYYRQANFEVHTYYDLGPFRFVHDRADAIPGGDQLYRLSGHLHPAIKLKGRARQSLTLSCFYFGESNGVLPAFGKFTGKCCLEIEESASVFAILDKKVMQITF
jgi:metallophosphoesterase superfamily enzyme